jgi:hypothetical protein
MYFVLIINKQNGVVKDLKIRLHFPYLVKEMYTFLARGKLLVWFIGQITFQSFNENCHRM